MKKLFHILPMMLLRLIHILTNVVNRICNSWSCNGNILEAPTIDL